MANHGARRDRDFEHQRRIVRVRSVAPRSANSTWCEPDALGVGLLGEPQHGDGAPCQNSYCTCSAIQSTSASVPSTRTTSVAADGCGRASGRASSGSCQADCPTNRSIAVGVAVEMHEPFAELPRQRPARGKLATTVAECFGQRLDLQRELRDDAQRAERAGEQFAEVVASDVFHDAAAAFERHAAAVDGVDADDVVAHRAVTEAARGRPVGGHDAAERGFARRGERRSAVVDARRRAWRQGPPSARRPRRGSSCRAACSRRLASGR